MNPRLIAARIINDVTDGHSLTDCLHEFLPQVKGQRDRAFIQAICYGVCRYYSSLDVILSYLLEKPMKAKDSDVHALLLVGLYQLIYMHVPAHAAVAETVNATEKLNKPWSRGLVNAILREYLRQSEQLQEKIKNDVEYVYAHPRWWIDAIKKSWPDNWQAILTANNEHPPLSLRVNSSRLSRDEYICHAGPCLKHAGVNCSWHPETSKENWMPASAGMTPKITIIPETKSGITFDSPLPAEEIPGFSAGEISVQDGAAQLAAELLELKPNLRVLDACAAPGGKLTHILEIEPKLSACVAVEKDQSRIVSIKENLKRLRLNAECICADVGDTKNWWDGKLFDRILLDAPCSASGVIRRHPDIKLLREPKDIHELAKLQTHLLESLWPLLKPGGLFLYATCSIFPEENVQVIQKFLSNHADAKEEPIKLDWGIGCAVGRQILPGMHNMDGFYYARVRRL